MSLCKVLVAITLAAISSSVSYGAEDYSGSGVEGGAFGREDALGLNVTVFGYAKPWLSPFVGLLSSGGFF